MSTSIRIRIPAKSQTPDDVEPSKHAEPPSMRRKSTASKRRTLVDSEEEGHRDKRPKTDEPEANAEMDVDVDGVAVDDRRFLPDTVHPRRAKGKGKKAAGPGSHGGGGSKKKRQIVYSDDDDDDVDVQDSALQDGDFDFEAEKRLKLIGKQKAIGKGGKGGGAEKGGKLGNVKEKEKDIKMKDERKGPVVAPPRNQEPKLAQMKPTEKPDESSSTASTLAAPSASSLFAPLNPGTPSRPATESMPQPPLPKKRKLPVIKKNKAPIQSGTSTPAQSQSQSQPSIAPQVLKGPAVNRTSADTDTDLSSLICKKPANMTAKVEVDLMNKNVYNQLFGAPGGSTPRSGLNRRERDEERRKELHRMRDEARAKREEEGKRTFNLQSQPDKIAKFEEPLKDKTSAFWPNFLGARFLDDWERTRRRARTATVGEEDGEVR